MRLLNQGLILDTSELGTNEKVAFFTSLCRLESGTLICGFQIGPRKHAPTSTIGLCCSLDHGQTWRRLPTQFSTTLNGIAGELSAAELVEPTAGRLLLFSTWFDRSDPDRPLFDPVTEGILKSKQLLSVSHDEGRTWSEWREISTGNLKGCAITGPCLRWRDGVIGFQFESFKEFDDPSPGRHAAWTLLSYNGGESFTSPLQIAQHPEHAVYYWDQRLCTGPGESEWTAMFWTHHLSEKRDLNVHLRRGRRGEILTNDVLELGPIEETSLPGQIAAPLWFRDDRLLAFVVNRDRPGTMTLWSSLDKGQTWPTDQRLVIHVHDEQAMLTQGQNNIDFRLYWEDMGKWSFGHPAIQLLDKTTVLLAWYAGTPDCMSIHWARVLVD